MSQKYTTVTEEVFNTVRHMQVVKTYPYEVIRHKTGVARTNQDKIRAAKTYIEWVARHPRLVKRAIKTQEVNSAKRTAIKVTSEINTEDAQQLLDDYLATAGKTPELVYATRADVTKLAHAGATDAGKLYDEIKKLRLRDAANSRSITANGKSVEKLHDKFDGLRFDSLGRNRLDKLDKQVEDLQAFRDTVKASPFLSRLLKRAAKRVEGAK